jgi:hypothetical protein
MFSRHTMPYLVPLLYLLFTCQWSSVSAFDWNNNYGTDASIGYDDNFRLSEANPVSTGIARIGVFADLQGTTEISSLRLALGANATNYSESSIDDSDGYNLSLDTARRGERWSGNFDLSLRSQSTTETEFEDTGKLVDGNRRTASVAPGANYQLDERNSIYANLGFSDVTYDTVSFTDYINNTLALGWVNKFSEISELSINGRVTVYDPVDNDTTTTSTANLGYDYSTSEATRYSIRLGYGRVESPAGKDTNGQSSFEFNHSIDERNGFSFFAGRGYVPSGNGNVRYESRLNLNWNHAIAERLQFDLTADVSHWSDRDNQSISAGVSHQYTREIPLGASLRNRAQQSESNNADSASALLSLYYSPI